ncbi:MAG TPA: zinc-dependent metalloprotease [Solirubrobacteraceae bacterium]|nr:zinc-dependent metalloprotease [Solirubrobacteraceae bacterium]
MIDWGLAERVADAVSGTPAGGTVLPGDLPALARTAEAAVTAYTGMRPPGPLPAPEAVDRATWARANLATMRTTLAPVVDRFDERLASAAAAGPLRSAAGFIVAGEIGGLVGLMARRVLGQYELGLLDLEAPARLLLVAPNVRDAARELDVDLGELLTWVTVHEVTHAVQFTAVPWLRPHLGALLSELLASAEVKLDPAAVLRMPSREDLAAWRDAVRDGGLVRLVAGPERKALLDRVQAAMALVEGHAEHVMDAAGAPLLRSLPLLRGALDRRRAERPPLWRLLERLLGLDLKMRQYEIGRRFVDGVVDRGGVAGLNRAWMAPEYLPTLAELEDPGAWLRRTGPRELPSA